MSCAAVRPTDGDNRVQPVRGSRGAYRPHVRDLPTQARIVVAAEPRNRELRFAMLQRFAVDLDAYLRPLMATESIEKRNGEREFAREAPQLVVPNTATRDYLGARLGRSLRYLDRGETPVPEETLWAGSYLSWFAEQSHYPGQSLFISSTEELRRHFATGQSALEDENLAVLLAWIRNESHSGRQRIRAAEKTPAFGPTPDPRTESRLDRMLRTHAAHDSPKAATLERDMRAVVGPLLHEAYAQTFDALDVLRELPEADHTPMRWAEDRRRWTNYIFRTRHGIPRFRVRHDALQAGRLVGEWSKARDVRRPSGRCDQGGDVPARQGTRFRRRLPARTLPDSAPAARWRVS